MTRATRIICAVAALAGAAGVAEAAAAAHTLHDPLLKTASQFLIVNATAALALSAVAEAIAKTSRSLRVGISLLLIGTLLFGGELTSHVFFPNSPFVFLAPIGGSLTILGWLIAAAGLFRASFNDKI
jgi:uncharacterized membrane protein YgdD (TMEM256/DUF423 family)